MLINTRASNKRGALLADLQCDECGEPFTKYWCLVKNNETHHCSTECTHTSLSSGKLRQQTKATNLTRYGSPTPSGNATVQTKTVATNLARYGVPRPTMSPVVQQKQSATCMQNNGVAHGCLTPQCRAATTAPGTVAKRHAAMKANGTYTNTKPEQRCYELLCEAFGPNNVERQVPIQGRRWPLDFYVHSVGVYVQEDGVYWHGLDRPIEIIAEHKTTRDVQIHKRILADIEQDEWFTHHNLRLLRIDEDTIGVITHIEFRELINNCTGVTRTRLAPAMINHPPFA